VKKIKRNIRNFFYRNFQKIFFILYGKIKYDRNIKKFTHRDLSSDILFENDKLKYFTYLTPNSRIYTDYIQNVALIKNNFLIKEGSYQQVNGILSKPESNSVIQIGTPRVLKKFKGKIFSLVQGISGENYFHWILDILPKFFIVSKNYKLKNIKYFYLPEIKKYQMLTLKLLGINKKKIINSKVYRHIYGDAIITVDHPWYNKGYIHAQAVHMPRWIIIWIKKKFLSYKKKFNCSKKIYIDRTESKFKHCQIINDNEIYNYLKNKGFKKYQVGKLNFLNQIYLFWSAKIIIGAHGAAFTNIIFCKPNTKIIEIRPDFHPGRNYERISKINKLDHRTIITKKQLNTENGDIFLPLQDLQAELKK
jgi:hypothetical protein